MIEQLKKTGLTEYEAKAYLALLEMGLSGGVEISKKSGVPKTRVYDVLKVLVEKGLVNIIQEKPMIFKAVKPEIGLKYLFERKIEEMKKAEIETFEALSTIKAKPEAVAKVHEKLTTVLGYEKMYSLSVDWFNESKKEISIFSVGEKIPYSLKIAIKRAVTRGVDCRLIVTKNDSKNRHILREHASLGLKLKHYPSSGEWTFLVSDKKRAMINIRNPEVKEERISIFFEIPDLAKSLSEYFEILWKKSKSIKF